MQPIGRPTPVEYLQIAKPQSTTLFFWQLSLISIGNAKILGELPGEKKDISDLRGVIHAVSARTLSILLNDSSNRKSI